MLVHHASSTCNLTSPAATVTGPAVTPISKKSSGNTRSIAGSTSVIFKVVSLNAPQPRGARRAAGRTGAASPVSQSLEAPQAWSCCSSCPPPCWPLKEGRLPTRWATGPSCIPSNCTLRTARACCTCCCRQWGLVTSAPLPTGERLCPADLQEHPGQQKVLRDHPSTHGSSKSTSEMEACRSSAQLGRHACGSSPGAARARARPVRPGRRAAAAAGRARPAPLLQVPSLRQHRGAAGQGTVHRGLVAHLLHHLLLG